MGSLHYLINFVPYTILKMYCAPIEKTATEKPIGAGIIFILFYYSERVLEMVYTSKIETIHHTSM